MTTGGFSSALRAGLASAAREIDWTLCLALCAIAGAGGAMLYSIDGGSWTPWAVRHLAVFAVSLIIMLGLAMVDLRVWFSLAYPLYVAGVALLAVVAVIGHTTLGARRWLDFGALTIQPSEIVKIGLVLALARFYHSLAAKKARMSWSLLIPVALIVTPVAMVARQPDLGTALLIFATGTAMMVMAGLSLRVVSIGLAAVGAGLPLVFKFALEPYQRARLLTFLDPQADKTGAGYHIIQSKIALGSGGLLGKGFGLGTQSQLNFLPEKQTDFIFASLAEEFGFVGCVSILVLYGAVIFMALRISSSAHSHFARLAAVGVTVTFALCVLINGAMVMGLAPVVGVPMPLLSYGGTVMITMMVGFGLVLSVRAHRHGEVTSGGALI